MVGGTVVSAGTLIGAAACTTDDKSEATASADPSGKAAAQPTPFATFPPGPTSSGTNIPRLAEAGRLNNGAHKHQVEVIWQIDSSQKLVALTFDDGPDPDLSPGLYDVLESTGTRATFFLIGSKVTKYAKTLADRMALHEVGNHTHSHESMFLKDQAQAYEDMYKSHKAIHTVTGQEPRLLRPPYGHLNGNTMLAAGSMGYDICMWSGYVGDDAFIGKEDELVQDVVKAAAPGTIFLAHDSGERRAIAIRNIGNIIKQLRLQKYEFVTVSELRAAQGK
jgi:peptidoglycan/xylan/chitin deacetylase (PgdA/CDA1 family)